MDQDLPHSEFTISFLDGAAVDECAQNWLSLAPITDYYGTQRGGKVTY
jgi:hypothetical protein